MTADVSLPDVARNVAVSADGAWLLASSYNIGSGIVRLWHMAGAIDTPGCRVLVGPDREVTRVAISGDATIIAAGDKASTTHIWKLGTTGEATALPRLTRPDGFVSLLAFDSGERLLCGTGSIRGGDLKVYSVDTNANATSVTGSCPELLRTGPTSLRPLAVSPDGKWLFASVDGMDGTLWQIDDKHATQAPGQISHSHVILDAAFSADGNWLLTGSIDKTARLWRLDGKGAADRAMELRHPSTVASVAFSPDSSWAATGSVDGTVRLWRISAAGTPAATCTATLGQHSAHVWAIAFSADGNRLLTGSGDQTARLWQLDGKGAATVIRTLRGHTRDVSSVALSKDGHLALTGSADKTVRVWSLGD
ncbi:MAG: WD40 repeat domain-containing protein [Planctomycetota bacterium]